MDILEFLNSKDIREYLYSIGYKPNLLESAYIVYNSELKTIKEKNNAWDYLIKNTEDMILNEEISERWANGKNRTSSVYGKSVHTLIKKYISEVQSILSTFYSDSGDGVYVPAFGIKTWRCITEDETGPYYSMNDSGLYFKSFEDARKYCQKEIKDDCSIVGYYINKHYYASADDERDLSLRVKFDLNGEPINACIWGSQTLNPPESLKSLIEKRQNGIDLETDFFGQMWFDIPIPFKKWDIVNVGSFGWGVGSHPFVLYDTDPWFRGGHTKNGQKYREGTDCSDMNARGWTVGFGENPDRIDLDVMADYLNLEYYKNEYRGKERLLPLLSEAMKGNLDMVDYELIKQEINRTMSCDYNLEYMIENRADVKAIVNGNSTWK